MLRGMKSTLLNEIEAFIATHGIAESAFGRDALNGDWRLIKELRGETPSGRPRRLWPETEAKIRHFMATYRPSKAA